MNEEWFLDYLFLKPMIFFWDLATIVFYHGKGKSRESEHVFFK